MAGERLPGIRDVPRFLAAKPFPSLWVLLGDAETAPLKEEVETQILAVLRRSLGDVERTRVDLKESDVGELLTLACSMPLFGQPRLIIVRGLEGLTKPRKEALLREITRAPLPGQVTVVFSSTGREIPPGDWVGALTRLLFWPIREERELAPWLANHLAQRGLAAGPNLARTLLELYGPDLTRIRSELEKARLFLASPTGAAPAPGEGATRAGASGPGGPGGQGSAARPVPAVPVRVPAPRPPARVAAPLITVEVLRQLAVPEGPEIFEVIDGLASGSLRQGLGKLPALLAGGESAELIMILLTTQMRRALVVAALASQKPTTDAPRGRSASVAGRLEGLLAGIQRARGQFFEERRVESEAAALVKSIAAGTPLEDEVGHWRGPQVVAALRAAVGVDPGALRSVYGTLLDLDAATRGGGVPASVAVELAALEIAAARRTA